TTNHWPIVSAGQKRTGLPSRTPSERPGPEPESTRRAPAADCPIRWLGRRSTRYARTCLRLVRWRSSSQRPRSGFPFILERKVGIRYALDPGVALGLLCGHAFTNPFAPGLLDFLHKLVRRIDHFIATIEQPRHGIQVCHPPLHVSVETGQLGGQLQLLANIRRQAVPFF